MQAKSQNKQKKIKTNVFNGHKFGWRFHFHFNFNCHEMPYYDPSRPHFTLKPTKHAPFLIKEQSYEKWNKLITNINYSAKRKYTFDSGAT